MIRPAVSADVPRIVELVGHFLNQTPYGRLFDFDPDRLRLLADGVILDLGVILLAELDGVIVGMVAATALPEPYTGRPIAEELAWWVEPAHRQGAIGPKLLAALETWARTKGLALVKMVEPAGTPGVGAYYRRRGYEPVEIAWVKRLDGRPRDKACTST